MEAFTSYHGRRTRIMGSLGDISGDGREFVHTDFRTGKQTRWQTPPNLSGHGGGDHALVFDWVRAVSEQESSYLSSGIDVSIESHIMGFKAEVSRAQGTVETIT